MPRARYQLPIRLFEVLSTAPPGTPATLVPCTKIVEGRGVDEVLRKAREVLEADGPRVFRSVSMGVEEVVVVVVKDGRVGSGGGKESAFRYGERERGRG